MSSRNNLEEEHRHVLKIYKRFKLIEYWKSEGDKFKNNNLKFRDIWKTLGEDKVEPQHINAKGEEWEAYFSNLYKNHIELDNENFESLNK